MYHDFIWLAQRGFFYLITIVMKKLKQIVYPDFVPPMWKYLHLIFFLSLSLSHTHFPYFYNIQYNPSYTTPPQEAALVAAVKPSET